MQQHLTFPYTSRADGVTEVWACCISEIGGVCPHRAGDTVRSAEAWRVDERQRFEETD